MSQSLVIWMQQLKTETASSSFMVLPFFCCWFFFFFGTNQVRKITSFESFMSSLISWLKSFSLKRLFMVFNRSVGSHTAATLLFALPLDHFMLTLAHVMVHLLFASFLLRETKMLVRLVVSCFRYRKLTELLHKEDTDDCDTIEKSRLLSLNFMAIKLWSLYKKFTKKQNIWHEGFIRL